MNILFNTSTYFGDAVVSTGVLAYLLDRHPGARVTIACGRPAAPLFTEVPNLDLLIPISKRKAHLHWWDIWRPCMPRLWDLVVDLKGSALPYLLLARKRLVFRPRHLQGGDRTTEWGHLLGLQELPPPRVWTSRRHEEAAEALLEGADSILALGPTASWARKIWPAERFVELAERLTSADGILPGASIAVIGAPGDERKVGPLLELLPPERLINLIGRTDLLTAAAVLKRSAFFAGNDSGPLYLSVAAGTLGLGLMGPTPGLFGPAKPPLAAPWAERTALVRTEIPLEDLLDEISRTTDEEVSMMGSLSVDAAEAAAVALWQRCAADHQTSC